MESAQAKNRTENAGTAVAVLGASAKEDRYSFKAVAALRGQGYAVYPVNPGLKAVQGLTVYPRLADIPVKLDTLTMYLSPERSTALRDEILQAEPRRVIFNPGAENPALAEALRRQGAETLDACTLVMLNTGQF